MGRKVRADFGYYLERSLDGGGMMVEEMSHDDMLRISHEKMYFGLLLQLPNIVYHISIAWRTCHRFSVTHYVFVCFTCTLSHTFT